MRGISKDDLASFIDVGRLRNYFSDKVNHLPGRRKSEEEVSTTGGIGKIVKITLIVVGVLTAIGGIGYALYRFFGNRYEDDFDDFDDAFDDDFYDDDDEDDVIA